jgi:hypothetical protein
MAGLPLVTLSLRSGKLVSVRKCLPREGGGDPRLLCGRGDCPHYSEQGQLFSGVPRDGRCALAEVGVLDSCVAYYAELAEQWDRERRAACSLDEAVAYERRAIRPQQEEG